MPKAILQEKITAASEQLTAAEHELDTALRELHALPRADKTMISKVMEDAFRRLQAAKQNLRELEVLLTDDGDGH